MNLDILCLTFRSLRLKKIYQTLAAIFLLQQTFLSFIRNMENDFISVIEAYHIKYKNVVLS